MSEDHLTRDALGELLAREGFRPDSYNLDGARGLDMCYVLEHGSGGWWHIYWSERGLSKLGTFATEAAACEYFLEVLRRDAVTRRT